MVMRSRHAVWQSRGRKREGEEGEESGSALPEFRGIIKWMGSLLCDFRTAKVTFGLNCQAMNKGRSSFECLRGERDR
jgi:hypothetical protein